MPRGHPRTMKIPPLEKGGWGDLKLIFYIITPNYIYQNVPEYPPALLGG